MTRDEILAKWESMTPRERDEWVAEKVMGYTREGAGWRMLNGNFTHHVRAYSDNIAAAWEVVEEMGDCLHLRQHGEQGEWEARFCGYPNSKAHGETAPESICKAALLAVMEE